MHSTEIPEHASGNRQAKTWKRLAALGIILGLIAVFGYETTVEETSANDDAQYLSSTDEDPLEFELKIDQNFPMENLISPPFIYEPEQVLDKEPLLGIKHLIDSPLTPITQKINLPTNGLTANPEEQNLFNLTLESMEQTSRQKVRPTQNKIVILKVVDYRDKQFLKIDSNSRIQLNDKIFDAINHEINLNFKIQMQLTEANRLLGIPYQRTRKSIDYHVKLLSEGLDQTFHLYNSRNGHTQSFRDIDDALETLSTIKAFEIAELSELHPRQIYTLRIRISLDIWKLPTPLLLEALFTDNWQLNSGWFETTLKAPQSWQ
ncbi:DUF4390 domain-containing protein [Thiomicrorhabdus indica]|uniref:DUF4390 domain-containing protein n=1 Tax=Thiomicrorhabdus indica TaxID=2267253 RepID=UPI002AA62CB2|nr:DUF4390 domain-containing protein [Thiomicrorhabdus indica]